MNNRVTAVKDPTLGKDRVFKQQPQAINTSANAGVMMRAPHSVVESEPRTGKFISIFSDEELARYRWLRYERPNWDFALKNNLGPDLLADEQKCRLLYSRGADCSIRSGKYASYKELGLVIDEPVFAPCGDRSDKYAPTMSWLEVKYERVKRDNCIRGEKRRKKGVDHLKVHGKATGRTSFQRGGLESGKANRRERAIYSRIRGTPVAQPRKPKAQKVPHAPVKGCVEQMRPATDDVRPAIRHANEAIALLLDELACSHGCWYSFPIMRKLIILTMLSRSKVNGALSQNLKRAISDARNTVYAHIDNVCKYQASNDTADRKSVV